jgi:hypothetical protein
MPAKPERSPLSGGAVPSKTLSRTERQKSVANMLGTMRVEKIAPSESLMPSLTAYIDGQKTTADLLKEVKAKYSAQQRG